MNRCVFCGEPVKLSQKVEGWECPACEGCSWQRVGDTVMLYLDAECPPGGSLRGVLPPFDRVPGGCLYVPRERPV